MTTDQANVPRPIFTRRQMLRGVVGAGAAMLAAPIIANASDEEPEIQHDPVPNSFRYRDGELIEVDDSNGISLFSSTPSWGRDAEGYWCNNKGERIQGALLRGIDVSSHQGKIDWEAAKDDGVDFAIIRAAWSTPYTNGAGQYKSGIDDYWERNVSECERLGIPYGAYIYSYSTNINSAAKYAEHILSLLKGHNPSYPIYIDIEDESTRDGNLNGVASTFCRLIESAGYKAGVYASKSWFTDYLNSSELNNWSKWVAQYYSECTYKGSYDMWQASSSTTINGVGRADINFDFVGLAGDSDVPSKKWSRVYGSTKLDTMAAISQEGWNTSGSVVLATIDRFMDALAASSLAGSLNCPILLTEHDALSSQAASEIRRLGVSHAYIIGGPIAVAECVDQSIVSLGCSHVERVYGNDYQATACAISNRVLTGSHSDTLIVATARTFHDALSISPYAYRYKAPVYLCDGNNTLSSATLQAIRDSGLKKAIILGGSLAVDEGVESLLANAGVSSVKRISGATRFETSALIANWELAQGMTVSNLAYATSDTFYDALAGGPLCGKRNSVLLVTGDDDKSNVTGFGSDQREAIAAGVVFGGPIAISHSCWNSIVRYCG